jgi:hypothetical protein
MFYSQSVADVIKQLCMNLKIPGNSILYALRDAGEKDELVTDENLRNKIRDKAALKSVPTKLPLSSHLLSVSQTHFSPPPRSHRNNRQTPTTGRKNPPLIPLQPPKVHQRRTIRDRIPLARRTTRALSSNRIRRRKHTRIRSNRPLKPSRLTVRMGNPLDGIHIQNRPNLG